MTDREKLIELIKQIGTEAKEVCNNSRCSECPGGKDCTYGLIANLIISHGVTFAKDTDAPSKWISVEDRLPEYDRKVLITDVRDGYMSIAELRAGGKILVDCWECDDTIRLPVSEVTHWMPLPQPPREE